MKLLRGSVTLERTCLSKAWYEAGLSNSSQDTRLQDDRLADLASDNARRARLEAIAAAVEMERGRECTFKPALSCGPGRRPADQENTDPADEVSLLRSAWHKLWHWQDECLSRSL